MCTLYNMLIHHRISFRVNYTDLGNGDNLTSIGKRWKGGRQCRHSGIIGTNLHVFLFHCLFELLTLEKSNTCSGIDIFTCFIAFLVNEKMLMSRVQNVNKFFRLIYWNIFEAILYLEYLYSVAGVLVKP